MTNESVIGTLQEVRVQPRGGGSPELRDQLLIEDLRGVLPHLRDRSGANGPLSPVTQYLLQEGAWKLARGLRGDLDQEAEASPVPKVLSRLVAHEPFVEGDLNMSRHQMMRRWPSAGAWYADLIAYILRPQRLAVNQAEAEQLLPSWLELDLEGFVREFANHQMQVSRDPTLYGLATTIQSLWPHYSAVQEAQRRYRDFLNATWGPLYEQVAGLYGLRLKEGVTWEDVVWTLEALVTQESMQPFASPEGAQATYTASAVMVYVAGATENLDGSISPLVDLRRRRSSIPTGKT